MKRDIPHRNTPGTFHYINFNSKYFNFIPNNAISFEIIVFHSKKYFFVHVYFIFSSNDDSKIWCFFNFDLLLLFKCYF